MARRHSRLPGRSLIPGNSHASRKRKLPEDTRPNASPPGHPIASSPIPNPRSPAPKPHFPLCRTCCILLIFRKWSTVRTNASNGILHSDGSVVGCSARIRRRSERPSNESAADKPLGSIVWASQSGSLQTGLEQSVCCSMLRGASPGRIGPSSRIGIDAGSSMGTHLLHSH